MRLLVLDGSTVLRRVVERLAPAGVQVESADTFETAYATLRERPPDALIVTLGPSDLPWSEIQRCCLEHEPPIPALFESCVWQDPEEAGLSEISSSSSFLRKPYSTEELRAEIDRLLAVAASSRQAHPRPTEH